MVKSPLLEFPQKATTRESYRSMLPDGVKLVNSATFGVFYPEGNYYFVRDSYVPMIWSKKSGWKKYYEVDYAESRFQTMMDAIEAWTARLDSWR